MDAALAMSSETVTHIPQRLGSINGLAEKRNDVIHCRPTNPASGETVVFFGGDIQNYKEVMLSHRDNQRYVEWDLESTAILLQDHFPFAEIYIIRPSKMALNTFCCYENFVEVNNFGAPTHHVTTDALKHLQSVLLNAVEKVCESTSGQSPPEFAHRRLKVIGFSKGCVVLNQLLFAFMALDQAPDDGLSNFVKSIDVMYWLEGGHSGASRTYVTDEEVLRSFRKLDIVVEIHVTPYQVMCDTRPRIGKEEKAFRETLKRLGVTVNRKLHFEDEPRSLEKHFCVLKTFKAKVT